MISMTFKDFINLYGLAIQVFLLFIENKQYKKKTGEKIPQEADNQMRAREGRKYKNTYFSIRSKVTPGTSFALFCIQNLRGKKTYTDTSFNFCLIRFHPNFFICTDL